MRVINETLKKEESKKLVDIEIGTVFTGTINIYSSTFLKAYESVIDLINPGNTWIFNEHCKVEVINFKEVDAELTIRKKA